MGTSRDDLGYLRGCVASSASDMGRSGLGDGEMGLEVGAPGGSPAALSSLYLEGWMA